MPDVNGVLSRVFDASTNSLRIAQVNDFVNIGAGEFVTAATTVTTNDIPRIAFPDAATTSARVQFSIPQGWTQADIGIIWTGSTAGAAPVRWRLALKKIDLFLDNVSEAFVADVTANIATPAVAGVVVATFNALDNVNVAPGAFGSTYSLLVERIGADGGDTYTGVAELLSVGLGRA